MHASSPSPRARRLAAARLTLGVLIAPCGAATALRAQAGPATRPGVGPAPAVRAEDAPPPGTRVRLTLADSMARLGGELFVSGRRTVEGRVIAMDTGTVVLRLTGGTRFAFPKTAVARLDARVGRGWCARSLPARATCIAAGALTGAADMGTFGAVALADAGEDRMAAFRGGGLLGGLLGGVAGVAVGRDRWRPVPGWSRR